MERKYILTSLNEYLNNNITLYHGNYISGLKVLKPYSIKKYSILSAIFLSSKLSVARDYGDIIYRCKLNSDNINTIDVNGNSFHDYTDFERDITESHDEGYDCVVFHNIMDSKEPDTRVPLSDIYVVFKSEDVIILNSTNYNN